MPRRSSSVAMASPCDGSIYRYGEVIIEQSRLIGTYWAT